MQHLTNQITIIQPSYS